MSFITKNLSYLFIGKKPVLFIYNLRFPYLFLICLKAKG